MPKREHAHSYAAYLDMAHGYPFALMGIDIHDITLIGSAFDIGNGTRENPWVETQQRLLLTSLQYYTLLHPF